ncbi:MAG TPA: hypothetical protein VJZ78_06690 [Anaerolineales bacterium]|nr:hypothetical protein [Anaerolineales bacterium]
MTEFKRIHLIKPGLDTPFHIDFDWWMENDRNWHVDLRGLLCQIHQESMGDYPEDQMMDWVDPETAEVKQMDGLQHILTSHCARQDDFLTDHTTLVDAVFRTFLVNGNSPLTPQEFSLILGRPALTILKTLGGPRVYKGIRPVDN